MADLAVWQRTIVDEKGNVIPGAEVEVRSYPGGSLITLYEGPDGVQVKGNPFSTGADGFARFWAESQRAEIVAHGAGSTIRWIVDLLNADEVIGDAVSEATAAAAVAVGEAEAAADRAEAARDAAQLNARIYPTVLDGVTDTADGDYFSVPSGSDDEYLILYRNDNGSAVETSRTPSSDAISTLIGNANVSLNFDEINKSGFYRDDSNAATGSPTSAGYTGILHLQLYDDRNRQIAIRGSASNPQFWVRSAAQGGAWGDWVELARQDVLDDLINITLDPFIGNAVISEDFDQIKASGFYRDTFNPADNSPTDDTYTGILHIQKFDDRNHQLAIRASASNPRVWVRSADQGGVWGDWKELAKKDDLDDLINDTLDPLLGNANVSPNFNEISQSGFYRDEWNAGSIGAPTDQGHTGIIHVQKFDDRNHQIAIRSNRTNPQTWVRSAVSGDWGDWKELAFREHVEALLPSDEVLSRIASQEPAFFDDFTRLGDQASGLGLARSGTRWHNTSGWEIRNGCAKMQASVGSGNRQWARTGFVFKDYIVHMTVDAKADFNVGWTYRSPNVETGMNPRLYCRFYQRSDESSGMFRLSYGESGSGDSDTELLLEAPWTGGLNTRHDFTFVQDGRRLRAFANGQQVMDFTISEVMDQALGHNTGINGQFYVSDNEMLIRRIAAYRLYNKPANSPIVFSHRMVTLGPFGSFSDSRWNVRNPELCLSALEKLPRGIGVEVDVRRTSDGHFILMHDFSIDRTTYGTGNVNALTLEQIKETRIRGVGGRQVPTLEEFLEALEDRQDIPEILLQLKLYDSQQVEGVWAAVDAAPASVKDRCVFFLNAEDDAYIDVLKALDPDARIAIGGRTNANEADIPTLVAKGVEIGIISAGDSNYMSNRDQVAALQNAGLKAYASTTQFHFTMRQIIEDGADGYLTDYPVASMA